MISMEAELRALRAELYRAPSSRSPSQMSSSEVKSESGEAPTPTPTPTAEANKTSSSSSSAVKENGDRPTLEEWEDEMRERRRASQDNVDDEDARLAEAAAENHEAADEEDEKPLRIDEDAKDEVEVKAKVKAALKKEDEQEIPPAEQGGSPTKKAKKQL